MYVYEESVTKVCEGGYGTTWIIRMTKSELKRKNIKAKISASHSPYVGQSAFRIYASTKEELVRALRVLAEVRGEKVSSYINWVEPKKKSKMRKIA